MKVVHGLRELRAARRELPEPFGLVPTMGYLHQGHLSLVRKAKAECASVGVSIFVNPTQFGPTEDLGAYPVDLPRDQAMLEREAVDLLWLPTAQHMYPPGFQTWIEVDDLARRLEGEHRPGHFRGVTTVVAKLFNAMRPDRAYFGQKDAQQAVVIRRMVRDLLWPVEVIVCPTVREPDGLALSSRNSYLSAGERKAAGVLYRSLRAAAEAFASGTHHAEGLRQILRATLASEPMARPHYVSAADPDTLDEAQGEVQQALLSLAVQIGKTTLIDNMVVGGEGS